MQVEVPYGEVCPNKNIKVKYDVCKECGRYKSLSKTFVTCHLNNHTLQMTKEAKELLLKDLCARVPYKTRVRYTFAFAGASAITEYSSEGILSYEKLQEFSLPNLGLEKRCVAHTLPYLRPMSSMTEEEVQEAEKINRLTYIDGTFANLRQFTLTNDRFVDWLNEHHFDYRGLIEKGLALEASEDMYKSK